ncbi:hypothetical protein [Allomesorhizobium alhagi]|uniref:Uncharacterized protein n=1 Tax=Mesorhizobium alhagi CCNWXJ12-2 TaxID=1107882 RepID=H0HQY9_9HYPH|nr:hypothetical protein [Mesorhizobium alhagi]EHK56851.1 hypothetical protein MAXJ12_12857 [Mesorhizobium alhagi CCNWXJ12-2]
MTTAAAKHTALSAKMKLNPQEKRLLAACCGLPEGKGVPVGQEWKKVARSLTRKGLAWTMESIFMVCIATDEGRAVLAEARPS